MQQDNSQIYYMVVDEKSTGPFTLDEVTLHPKLTPETLVWKPGIDNWVAAKTLPELAQTFANERNVHDQIPPDFHNPGNMGQNYDNPHPHHNHFADNPQYHTNHSYQHHNQFYQPREPYRDPYRPTLRTNWLPWAIVATVVGFFTSCIGAIFGIIGIVQANKANTMYARGYEREGDAANSNARIMTIIGLIFAALGILALLFFGSFFNSIASYSSYM